MKREIGEEWSKKSRKNNLVTLIIEKDRLSYRGFGDKQGNNEFTGSQTGNFNLSGKKLVIPQYLQKYTKRGRSEFTGNPFIKIKMPKGKFIRIIVTSMIHQYPAWQRSVGTSKVRVIKQTKFKKPTY